MNKAQHKLQQLTTENMFFSNKCLHWNLKSN